MKKFLLRAESLLHVLVVDVLAGGERSVVGSVSRVDDHHLHLKLPQLRPQHLGEGQECRLKTKDREECDLVTDLAGGVGPQGGERTLGTVADHVDHTAPAPHQQRQTGPGESQRSQVVDLQLAPGLPVSLPESLAEDEAGGVVDEAVEALLPRHEVHGPHGVLHTGRRGHVQLHHRHSLQQAQLSSSLPIREAASHHLQPQLGAVDGQTEAEARVAARDKDCLPSQLKVVWPGSEEQEEGGDDEKSCRQQDQHGGDPVQH